VRALQGTEVRSPMDQHGPSNRPSADPAGLTSSRPVSTASILVVDDDPATLTLIDPLRRAGAEVTALTGGREALRAVADGFCRPTLLLTGIDMPGMTGIELSARVRALRPGIRVVMMTANPASAAAARDRPDLVMRVLLKPVAIAELLEATGLTPAEPR
jgi:CheY-like chemotaxis protein